jgi:hypothetical protein
VASKAGAAIYGSKGSHNQRPFAWQGQVLLGQHQLQLKICGIGLLAEIPVPMIFKRQKEQMR